MSVTSVCKAVVEDLMSARLTEKHHYTPVESKETVLLETVLLGFEENRRLNWQLLISFIHIKSTD
jgi:hypothetical protein